MAKTKIQDEDEVLRWFAEGRTYQWMVGEYLRKYKIATVHSMWGNFRRRHSLAQRVTRDADLIPWKVSREHRWDYDLVMLRVEARQRAGATLTGTDKDRLQAWKRRLSTPGKVVTYDEVRGFSHVAPRTGLDLDLIRIPDHVTKYGAAPCAA